MKKNRSIPFVVFCFVVKSIFYFLLSIPLLVFTWVLYRSIMNQRLVYRYGHLPTYNEKYTFDKRSREERYLVLIGVETINLAETTRMLQIADYIVEHHGDEVEVKFFHYGGAGGFKYEDLIHETSYEITKLQPEWKTHEEIEYLYQVDRGEVFDDIFPPELFRERVKSELELYEKLRPNLILTGFCLTAKVSSQIANIPYFITMPILYVDLEYYLSSIFQFLPHDLSHSLNFGFNRFFMYMLRKVTYMANLFKDVTLEYEVFPKTQNSLNIIEGDKTLITDVPELIGWTSEELRKVYGDESYVFVGSLFARIPKPVPEDLQPRINKAKKDGKKILYFAMGSSGKSEMVINILRELDSKFKEGGLGGIGLVISPTIRLIESYDKEDKELVESELLKNLDDRIYLSQPNLPADRINEICDFGIIHGGQGTVQSAVSGGMPFVGVPCQPEHQMNIEHIVGYGAAVIVSKSSAMKSGVEVVQKLEYLMENEDEYRKNVGELRDICNRYNAAEIICNMILDEIRQ